MGFLDQLSGADLGGISSAAQAITSEYMARQQRNWQEEMASTAYQRTVGDLQAAGLNPMLAYRNSATSVGSGATGQAPDFAGGIEKGAHTAVENQLLEKTKAETRNENAQADRNEQIADIMKAIGPRVTGGISAVESTAGAVGTAAAKVEEAIKGALEWGKDLIPKGDTINDIIDGIIQDLKPVANVLSPPALLERAKKSMGIYPMPPAKSVKGPWGKGEYERAQEERMERARQSPASRKRNRQ